MKALKIHMDKKKKNTEHKWKQVVSEVYQNMDDIDMYGLSIYSKVDHSNRFWKDTCKVGVLTFSVWSKIRITRRKTSGT